MPKSKMSNNKKTKKINKKLKNKKLNQDAKKDNGNRREWPAGP